MVTASAYLAAALIVIATLLALKGRVEPRVLRALLGYFFIASLSAGLDPATVKAAALATSDPARVDSIDVRAALAASVLKGLAASPFLALVWRFADPAINLATLGWTPGLCVAGFVATDLRVLFDLRGRHATAIWVKQGGLAAGLALTAALAWLRVPLAAGVAVSTLARLAFVAVAASVVLRPMATRAHAATTVFVSRVNALLVDRRWPALAGASLVAAISGSSDRVFGLRFLSAEAWAGYYLLYEVFSKFWFIPYLLSPILFARRLADGPDGMFPRVAWRLTSAAGVEFLSVVVAAIVLARYWPPVGLHLVLGLPTVGFAGAVVINSFTQLRIAELQAAGAARRVLLAMGLSAGVSAALFYNAARGFGAVGLLIAWLLKALFEFAAITAAARWPRRLAPQAMIRLIEPP